MRNALSFQRIVRPTLFLPPNSFTFIECERTMTGSGASSAFEAHPAPYSNGTSNIGKKPPVVMRVLAWTGSMGPFNPSPETMPSARYMIAVCFGMSE